MDFLEKIQSIHYSLMDCYDLVSMCYKHYRGIILPPANNKRGDINKIHSEFMQKTKENFIKLDKAEPYTIVMMSLRGALVSHCGFMLDNENFIHIYDSIGYARIDNINRYSHLIRGYYDFVAK